MEKNRPERKFKAGPLVATLWKNSAVRPSGEKGEFYTVSLDRSYKDKAGKWAKTSSLRVNDLPKAVLVLQKAYEYITFKDLGLASEAGITLSDEEIEEI